MKQPEKFLTWGLILLLTALVIATIVLGSVPPVDRDALTHHLAIPKLYLQHGGIYEIPNLNFSYYPMTLDMLYMLPLALGNDIVPKYIHFIFSILTSILIYRYLKSRIGYLAALLGCLLFLSTPIITKLSTTVYVDLGLVFFSTASFLLLLNWQESHFKLRFLILSAISCGLAVATKYLGLISLMLLTAFIPFIYGRCTQLKVSTKCVLGSCILFILIAILVPSPWFIRNYIWTGNPLYPLFDTLFNSEAAASISSPVIDIFSQRKILFNESSVQIALLPLRVFFEGQDNNPQYFDGRLNPFLLLLPLVGLFMPNPNTRLHHEKVFMALFSALFFFFVLFQHGMRIRYIASIVPFLTILSIIGLKNMVDFANERKPLFKKGLLSGIGIITCIMIGYNAVYINQLFEYVRPIDYNLNRIDKDIYIASYVQEYPATQYGNNNIPENKTVLCLFLGNRGYHMKFKHIFDLPTSKQSLMHQAVFHAIDIAAFLKEKNIDYILMRNDLTVSWMNSLDEKMQKQMHIFFQNNSTLLYDKDGYSLHAIISM